MNGLWAVQTVCDFVLLGLIATLWWMKRSRSGDEKLTAYLNVLEARAGQLESEVSRYKDRCESQLKALARICEQARTILERGRWQQSLYPTLEEDELKEAAQLPSSAEAGTSSSAAALPNVRELEKDRAHSSTNLDLRSLLKDQFA